MRGRLLGEGERCWSNRIAGLGIDRRRRGRRC